MHLLDRREHALAWDEHAVAARAVVQAVPAVHGLVPHLHGGLPFRALLVVLTLTSDVLFSIPPSSLGLQALEVIERGTCVELVHLPGTDDAADPQSQEHQAPHDRERVDPGNVVVTLRAVGNCGHQKSAAAYPRT